MKVIIVLALCLAAAIADHTTPKVQTLKDLVPTEVDRIISGSPATQGQFPWQVAVTINGASFCGGSVLNENWVLTAAHCAQGGRTFNLRFGATARTGSQTGIVDMVATESVVHENYNSLYLTNDIALIKLPTPLTYTNNIQPVKLPSSGSVVGAGESVTVSGWGKTSDLGGVSEQLNYVNLNTISDAECASVYGAITINGKVVCCRGNPEQSTCNGDSGGPLVQGSTQVGVVSFVHVDGCASGQPSGYTRTESFLSWISSNTRMDF